MGWTGVTITMIQANARGSALSSRAGVVMRITVVASDIASELGPSHALGQYQKSGASQSSSPSFLS